jgi:type II secretory pathway pseudopilin PulG
MSTSRPSLRADSSGYSLVELLVALGVTTVIMGATMVGLSDAVRANESVMKITGMNNMLRVSMDLLVRDLLQVGAGLPPGHVIGTPSGAQSQPILLPGPPGSAFSSSVGDTDIAAVVPLTGLGPVINGVATDTITVLMADNILSGIEVDQVTPTSVDVDEAIDLESGPTKVAAGQLIMVTKGSCSTLVQVTDLLPNGKIMFSASDSMNLNQPQAKEGSLSALDDCEPKNGPAVVSRIRMISYYIDATTNPARPRLVRRVNNGDAVDFDNTLGTAVGLDIENLQISYDLVDGGTSLSQVRFTPADRNGTGRCSPEPCVATQIRKVNIALTARSKNATLGNRHVYRNTLTSQVSLRSMSFANEYVAP